MPPSLIGPYRVLETLGSGGVGTVYRAIDRRTGEPAALKLLSTGPALDPRAARRLAREFETLSDLSHPNVVKVFDTGVHQGYPYLAMELVEGLNLRQYLSMSDEDLHSGGLSSHSSFDTARPGRVRSPIRAERADEDDDDEPTGDSLPPFDLSRFADESPSEDAMQFESGPDSVRALADLADEPDTLNTGQLDVPWESPSLITAPPEPRPHPVDLEALNRPERLGRLTDAMLQLCQALAYIHAHGLVHRDLKPSNVMVDEDRIVRLMDFGLAKFLADDGSVTGTGRLVGTYRYMAPEQILGEPLDARADLYSLGVILYELLSGRPPFDARTPHELWTRVLESEASPLQYYNPRVDAYLSRIAMRLIRKEPDDRFQTAEEVYEALSEA
ncbi:MAG: protein kinase [Myxococcaceae bacterium]|nr:protein kinase [Myxococcaceae bacterium]